MLVAIAYRVSWEPGSAMPSWLVALALGLLMVGAMVLTAIVVTMVTPVIVGCCVAVAPVVGQVALAAGLIAAYAYFFKP